MQLLGPCRTLRDRQLDKHNVYPYLSRCRHKRSYHCVSRAAEGARSPQAADVVQHMPGGAGRECSAAQLPYVHLPQRLGVHATAGCSPGRTRDGTPAAVRGKAAWQHTQYHCSALLRSCASVAHGPGNARKARAGKYRIPASVFDII